MLDIYKAMSYHPSTFEPNLVSTITRPTTRRVMRLNSNWSE